jgi:hypothetical protein
MKKGRGQPKSTGTIRLLKDGTARLAADLAKVGDEFIVRFKGSKISLSKVGEISAGIQRLINQKNAWPLVKAYASNGGAASPLISLMGTLTAMGFPGEVQENLAGEYEVKIVDKMIEFDLDHEVKK